MILAAFLVLATLAAFAVVMLRSIRRRRFAGFLSGPATTDDRSENAVPMVAHPPTAR